MEEIVSFLEYSAAYIILETVRILDNYAHTGDKEEVQFSRMDGIIQSVRLSGI